MARFDGRSAIVTGGALGIGGGCARRIAADGGSVLIVDVNEEASASTVKEIRAVGGTVESMVGNVAEESVAAEMVEKAVAATRQLAKRQCTWLRSWPELNRLDADDPKLLPEALKLLGSASIS